MRVTSFSSEQPSSSGRATRGVRRRRVIGSVPGFGAAGRPCAEGSRRKTKLGPRAASSTRRISICCAAVKVPCATLQGEEGYGGRGCDLGGDQRFLGIGQAFLGVQQAFERVRRTFAGVSGHALAPALLLDAEVPRGGAQHRGARGKFAIGDVVFVQRDLGLGDQGRERRPALAFDLARFEAPPVGLGAQRVAPERDLQAQAEQPARIIRVAPGVAPGFAALQVLGARPP